MPTLCVHVHIQLEKIPPHTHKINHTLSWILIGFYQKIVRCDVGYDQMSQAGHCLQARDKQSHGLATQPNIPHIEI